MPRVPAPPVCIFPGAGLVAPGQSVHEDRFPRSDSGHGGEGARLPRRPSWRRMKGWSSPRGWGRDSYPMADLQVQSGAVIALRLFDIAYSIDLKQVEELWALRNAGKAVRSSLVSAPAKALAFDVPPVLITLDPLTLTLGKTPLTCTVTARIYDFGVAALSVRVPASDMSWPEFTAFSNSVDRLVGPGTEGGPLPGILERLRNDLSCAMNRPNTTLLQEDHLIAVVQQWNEPVSGADLPERIDLVPLLSGENRVLSEKARKDLLGQRYSYYEDDLVVMTWDRAFIYEPRNEWDVADIIEVANAQLLEFRYYDRLLDEELPRMYGLVKEARRAANRLSSRRFADLARKLYTLVAEVTELTGKAGNVLQVTEDVYLARIYQASLEIFRVPTVSAAVDRKLSIVRDTYAALYAEASGARGELLELAIILLIVIEIVIALVRHAG